jgi:hypothetical protein
VASFYNDYRGGEDITKNHKRFFQYTGKMLKKKESVKEGQKRDYEKAYTTFYNAYKNFANASMDVAKESTKISGDKTDQKIILKNFKKHVIPFIGLMSSWNKGHQKNPHLDESVNEGTKAFLAYREMKEALNVAIYGIKKMRKFIDDAPYNPKFNMITKELYKWEIDLEKKWRRVVPQISKISKDKMLESVNEKMSPAQYHSYMQYVFDTQFKTPDEKKMKKSIIKKINVAQKKKGLPLYKESVNEKWSKGLERYKVTLENGKEIDVKVKEGVGLEGIGKLLEKEGLKFEKITKKASRPTLTPESVNEARETAIDIAKRVVKNKQHEKGLDLTTANFIVKIYDAYKEHPNLQRQMKKMPLPKMVKLAYKVMK